MIKQLLDKTIKLLQNNTLLYCAVLLLVLKIVAVVLFINLPQNIFFADITKSVLEKFVNQTRQSLGLNPLLPNEKLSQAAKLKAENMVQNQYFSHTSPTGVSPWFWFAKAGYNYKYAGENLAVGFFESEEVYNAWLNSPSHRENIINPKYTEVGTAVLKGFGGDNTVVVVQTFGSPSVTNINKAPTVQVENTILEKTEIVIEAPEAPEAPEVLSQSIEIPTVFNYDYERILQGIIYVISLIVLVAVIVLATNRQKVIFERMFVFRVLLIVFLLSISIFLNKEIIIALIPHQIVI